MKNFRVLFIYPNTMMAILVPLHLPILSACLKRAGFGTDLFDTTYYRTEKISFDEKKVELLQVKKFNLEERGVTVKNSDIYEDLRKKVEEYKPDLIAVTLVEGVYGLASSLLESIKDFDIPVIAGGVFATFSPEEVISNDNIDMICLGEGEEAIVELCESMRRGEDFRAIRNLWVKQGDKIIKNSIRKTVNINDLPFLDYDIFEPKRLLRPMYGKVNAMIHVELDRGCPYSCTYCESPELSQLYKKNDCGFYYRRKSTDRIIEEMEWLVGKHSPKYVYFNSESFLAKPAKVLREFGVQYKKRIALPFWCQSRPETVSEDKIEILKDMNCQNLQFGLEHGNEAFRAGILNRHHTNRQIVEGLKIVEKYKINYTVNNMIGFPDETRELIFDTINLNREVNPTTMNCYIFTPFKGTRLHKYCIDKGYLKDNYTDGRVLDGVELKMDSISYKELKGLQRTFVLYGKMPKSEWGRIRKAEKFDKEGNEAFESLREVYYDRYFN